MSSNTCFSCNSIIESGIKIDSNYYCSEECYEYIFKKCEFCFKTFNIIKDQSFLNEPYYFCSINHMNLANPGIRFGVIGGPIGGHLGKPTIIIDSNEPSVRSEPLYVAPAPASGPPGLKRKSPPPGLQISKPPIIQQSKQSSIQQSLPSNTPIYSLPQQVINGVPVFRPYPLPYGYPVVFF